MMLRLFIFLSLFALAVFVTATPLPTTHDDFFLPGSQPYPERYIESHNVCVNCHGYHDMNIEQSFPWLGTMMANAARDPLFHACMAIANQDAPQSGDLCIRCHAPNGWLSSRSTPSDGSALIYEDFESVNCSFCHQLVKPSPIGVNPFPSDPDYTSSTYAMDQAYLSTLNSIPSHSSSGMYIVDESNTRRGPFVEAWCLHDYAYSPFHREANMCGTCHDVSNPLYMKDVNGKYIPNDWDAPSPSTDPYTMFPIERTFSEWAVSDYNTPEGVPSEAFGGNRTNVSTCQHCHMRATSGIGCGIFGPDREDLPYHDLTGGNTVVPKWIADRYESDVDTAALYAAILRARYMLQNAATLTADTEPVESGLQLTVRVTNETGHKLPSGYPEGRRMWINIQAYDSDDELVYESAHYDSATATLSESGAKIYEVNAGLSSTIAATTGNPFGPSFHFVLNDTIFKDNRIPPRGATMAELDSVQAAPVNYTYADGQYWDDTDYTIPPAAVRIEVKLFYQTASKEYIEFLRDENETDSTGQIAYDLWAEYGKSPPELMASKTILLPAAIADLTILATETDQDSAGIKLTWSPIPGAVRYHIYETAVSGGLGSELAETTNSFFEFTRALSDMIAPKFYYVTADNE